jgi:hypothetical protein
MLVENESQRIAMSNDEHSSVNNKFNYLRLAGDMSSLYNGLLK